MLFCDFSSTTLYVDELSKGRTELGVAVQKVLKRNVSLPGAGRTMQGHMVIAPWEQQVDYSRKGSTIWKVERIETSFLENSSAVRERNILELVRGKTQRSWIGSPDGGSLENSRGPLTVQQCRMGVFLDNRQTFQQ
jgi:hypothetical protein